MLHNFNWIKLIYNTEIAVNDKSDIYIYIWHTKNNNAVAKSDHTVSQQLYNNIRCIQEFIADCTNTYTDGHGHKIHDIQYDESRYHKTLDIMQQAISDILSEAISVAHDDVVSMNIDEVRTKLNNVTHNLLRFNTAKQGSALQLLEIYNGVRDQCINYYN